MAVASPRPPASPTAPPPAPGRAHAQSKPAALAAQAERWVEWLQWFALAVFIAVPVFAHLEFMQPYAGRLVWTMVVASIPLFIVLIGYHRWRRLCPLAFFAQIPVRLRRPGVKRAAPWLEANYYYVAFAVFFFSLW